MRNSVLPSSLQSLKCTVSVDDTLISPTAVIVYTIVPTPYSTPEISGSAASSSRKEPAEEAMDTLR